MSLAAALQTANIIEDAYEAGREAFKSLPPGIRKGIKAGTGRLRKRAKRSWDTYRKDQGPKFSFGAPVGSDTTKRHLATSTNPLNLNSRTLYTRDLVSIPLGTNNEINQRQRAICNVRGVSLMMNFRNNFEDALYVNVAVIVPRYNQALAAADPVDFFRGNGPERGRDFNIALTGLEMHTLSINHDKYHVLFHRRFTLAPKGPVSPDFSTGTSLTSYRTMKKYIKINRQIRFEGNVPVMGRVQLVYWFNDFDDASGNIAETNACTVAEHHVTYFKDSM